MITHICRAVQRASFVILDRRGKWSLWQGMKTKPNQWWREKSDNKTNEKKNPKERKKHRKRNNRENDKGKWKKKKKRQNATHVWHGFGWWNWWNPSSENIPKTFRSRSLVYAHSLAPTFSSVFLCSHSYCCLFSFFRIFFFLFIHFVHCYSPGLRCRYICFWYFSGFCCLVARSTRCAVRDLVRLNWNKLWLGALKQFQKWRWHFFN